MMDDGEQIAQVAAFREYRDGILALGSGLWTPTLGEGFFAGWDAAIASLASDSGTPN